jgi:hypothetical protein
MGAIGPGHIFRAARGPRVDDLPVLNGHFLRAAFGRVVIEIPERYGSHTTVCDKFDPGGKQASRIA